MKVDGHNVVAGFKVQATVDDKTVTVKASTDKAVLKVGDKEVKVERKGHGDYEVKTHHIHHGDHVTKKAAREIGEQAIKAVRKAAREEVRKHK
jgi:hypothetical protein